MKRLLLKVLALVAALTVGTRLYAAPPANDNLANAQALTDDIGALCIDTSEATLEESEPVYNFGETNTVWYKWTSTAKEKMPFHLYASQMTGVGGVCIDVYTNVNESAEASFGNLRLINRDSRLEFCAEPGKTYLIRVSTHPYRYGKSGCEAGYRSHFNPGKVALCWWRELAEGEWRIFAADGIAFNAAGDLPEDLKAADFPAGVTEIADSAFSYLEGVKFVTIPATVTQIDDYAFAWQPDLAWVDYEGDTNVVAVADTAFIGTPYSRELPFKLILDTGVSTNEKWNADCTVATTNVKKYCAIEGFIGTCPAEFVIPEGVTEVYEEAFYGATTLTKVTFPSTLEVIEPYAFLGCSALEEVGGIPVTAEVDDLAFCGSLYESVRPFELVTYEEEDGEWKYEIDEWKWIANGKTNTWVTGFHGTCPEELTIPEGVYGIEGGAFSLSEDYYDGDFDYDCGDYPEYPGNRLSLVNLKKITLAATVAEVYDDAFSYLPNLEEVVILGKDTYVDEYAFFATPWWIKNGESGFGEFTLYYESSDYEYDGDHNLISSNLWVCGYSGRVPETIVIPDGVYGIDRWAFEDCDSVAAVTIPASVKVIDDYAFFGCENLATVTYLGNKEEMEIGDQAFVGTPYGETLPFKLLYSYSYKYDGDGNVVSSNLWVYGYVGKVPETVVIPDGVYGIACEAFWRCDGVKALTIPASVKVIDEEAFAKCENLATVTFLGNRDEMDIGDMAFVGTPYGAAQPFKLLADYYTRDGEWESLYDEYGCYTGSVYVAYAEPRGSWSVYGYVGTCPEKLDLSQWLTNSFDEVYLEDGVFAGVGMLTELVLPNAEYDSWAAFRGCKNLATVAVGGAAATNKVWLTDNFQGTPWLDKAVPFELVTEVEVSTNTFVRSEYNKGSNCCTPYDERWTYTVVTNVETTKLVVGYYGNVPATLTFPEDVDAIDSYVFSGCDNITEVVVPGNVKRVGYNAFEYCGSLQNVEFQEGVEEIADSIFYGCGDGMQVILPVSAVVSYYDEEADVWRGGCFDYGYVFNGIDGDVDVVAPRSTSIYDRAFYDDDENYFGRTCVEYFTYVALDANGGTFEGDSEYRCFDDVVSGLPTPVRAGYVFREWRDGEGRMYRNGDVWGANEAQVYLAADWAVEKKYTVYGIDGSVEIALGDGDNYETLVRVLEDAYGTTPRPSRHGLSFAYWTVDGEELNHRSVIGENSTFGAHFDEFNPLTDTPEAEVDATAAQTYDGYVLDYKGANVGTIQVKVGKVGRTGEAKVSATVQIFGSAKLSFKADPKGAWKIEDGASTKGVTLSSAKTADKIVIDISENGILGTFGAYDVIGSRNTSKTDAKYVDWSGRTYEVAFKTKEGTGSAFTGGYSGVTVSIANKGKVKITGVMADGAKVSASAQLLISDKGEGCINAFVPMYAGKKGGFGFVLWIDNDHTTAHVESVSTWVGADPKSPFSAELETVGVAVPTPAGEMTFALEAEPTISGATVLTDYLPKAVKATFNGGKITVAKANTIKVGKDGTPIRTGTTDNDAGLKLNYQAKTGSFKGSFTVYTLVNSKLKKVKSDVNGVFVNGVGYGTAVIKNVGSLPVTVR